MIITPMLMDICLTTAIRRGFELCECPLVVTVVIHTVLLDIDRGICYFFIEVECASKDLHSGVFGGTVYVLLIFANRNMLFNFLLVFSSENIRTLWFYVVAAFLVYITHKHIVLTAAVKPAFFHVLFIL